MTFRVLRYCMLIFLKDTIGYVLVDVQATFATNYIKLNQGHSHLSLIIPSQNLENEDENIIDYKVFLRSLKAKC